MTDTSNTTTTKQSIWDNSTSIITDSNQIIDTEINHQEIILSDELESIQTIHSLYKIRGFDFSPIVDSIKINHSIKFLISLINNSYEIYKISLTNNTTNVTNITNTNEYIHEKLSVMELAGHR